MGCTSWEQGYKLGEDFSVPNGSIECGIYFYITSRSLGIWHKLNYQSIPLDIEFALSEFKNAWLEKYKKFLLDALKALIRQYRGFPSSIFKTERINFCFDEIPIAQAMVRNPYGDFRVIFVSYDINCLNEPKAEVMHALKHELLHIVSKLHEGEDKTKKAMIVFQRRLSQKIEENRKIIDKCIGDVLSEYEGNPEASAYAKGRVESFYKYARELFWSLIADSALNVIAIELGDAAHIEIDIERDKNRIRDLIARLEYISSVEGKIMEKEGDETKRNRQLGALKLMQFMECFKKMPFEAVAYAILGDNRMPKKRHFIRNLLRSFRRNKAQENIGNFKSIVNQYCYPEVAEGFLRFYEDYLGIVSAQAIRSNPLNPDIAQQIHNTECLKRGRKAYATLNKEFYRLFSQLK